MLFVTILSWVIVRFAVKPKYIESLIISVLLTSIPLMIATQAGASGDIGAALAPGIFGGLLIAAIVALLVLKPFLEKWWVRDDKGEK